MKENKLAGVNAGIQKVDRIFGVKFERYITSSISDGYGLGDLSEGICIYSDLDERYLDRIVAIEKEDIIAFVKDVQKDHPDIFNSFIGFDMDKWDGQINSLSTVLDTISTRTDDYGELGVGDYTFTTEVLDVASIHPEALEKHIESISNRYPKHAQLRVFELEGI